MKEQDYERIAQQIAKRRRDERFRTRIRLFMARNKHVMDRLR